MDVSTDMVYCVCVSFSFAFAWFFSLTHIYTNLYIYTDIHITQFDMDLTKTVALITKKKIRKNWIPFRIIKTCVYPLIVIYLPRIHRI